MVAFSICGRRLAIDDLKFAIPFSLHFCRAAVTDRDSKKRIGAFRKTESLHIVRVVTQMTDEAVEDDRAETEVGGFQVDMLSDDAGIEFLQVIKGLLRLADENERRRLKEHMRLSELFFCFLVDGRKKRSVRHDAEGIARIIVLSDRRSERRFHQRGKVFLRDRLVRVGTDGL